MVIFASVGMAEGGLWIARLGGRLRRREAEGMLHQRVMDKMRQVEGTIYPKAA
jgi:hypothetical protein